MKMTPRTYNYLFNAIRDFKSLYTPETWQQHIRDYQACKTYNDWRIAIIWSVLHAVQQDMTLRDMIFEEKLKDAHITTALKKIFKELGDIYP